MIYLDSSALLKLLIEERESTALGEWLASRSSASLVSSELAKVEVLRACRRVNEHALPAARALLSEVDLVPLSSDVVDAAAEVGDSTLRSLDAIHLASALSIRGHLSAFLVYDHRLRAAAVVADLAPQSPGA